MKTIKMISFGFCIALLNQTASAKSDPQAEIKSCISAYQKAHYQEAMSLCRPIAEQNHALAQFLVANMMDSGLGTQTNTTEALSWLSKSAKNGNGAAQLKLAKHLSTNHAELKANPKQAVQYLKQAAAAKIPEAQFLLAVCYLNGFGVKRDFDQSHHWYNQAVKSGLTGAKALSKPLLPRVSHHEQSPGAQEYDIATRVSDEESDMVLESDLMWRQLAAEKGHPQAQFEMSHVAKHTTQGQQWLEKAANSHHQEAEAEMALVRALGIHHHANLQDAIFWYQQACAPHTEAAPTTMTAQNNMGLEDAVTLLQTSVDDQDIHAALSIIDRCAYNDDTAAQLYLAKLYIDGKYVHQNKSLAAHLLEKAAQKGNLEAQYSLGWMYFHGDGIQREYLQAYYWFNKANQNRVISSSKNMLTQFERSPYS